MGSIDEPHEDGKNEWYKDADWADLVADHDGPPGYGVSEQNDAEGDGADEEEHGRAGSAPDEGDDTCNATGHPDHSQDYGEDVEGGVYVGGALLVRLSCQKAPNEDGSRD